MLCHIKIDKGTLCREIDAKRGGLGRTRREGKSNIIFSLMSISNKNVNSKSINLLLYHTTN